eukprot:538969-Prymnesium_polylepis.1
MQPRFRVGNVSFETAQFCAKLLGDVAVNSLACPAHARKSWRRRQPTLHQDVDNQHCNKYGELDLGVTIRLDEIQDWLMEPDERRRPGRPSC